MKILIADDDPISRRLLQASLVNEGYDVVITRAGAEAWHILQREDAPQLAILDWLMPGLDGVEVCRKVRQRTRAPYVYLVLLTGKGRKEDVVEGMEAGADDYLTKPFDPHELQVRLPWKNWRRRANGRSRSALGFSRRSSSASRPNICQEYGWLP